jgi:hypothetical protein
MSNNAATLVGTDETPSSFPGSRKNAFSFSDNFATPASLRKLVEPDGIEPTTS